MGDWISVIVMMAAAATGVAALSAPSSEWQRCSFTCAPSVGPATSASSTAAAGSPRSVSLSNDATVWSGAARGSGGVVGGLAFASTVFALPGSLVVMVNVTSSSSSSSSADGVFVMPTTAYVTLSLPAAVQAAAAAASSSSSPATAGMYRLPFLRRWMHCLNVSAQSKIALSAVDWLTNNSAGPTAAATFGCGRKGCAVAALAGSISGNANSWTALVYAAPLPCHSLLFGGWSAWPSPSVNASAEAEAAAAGATVTNVSAYRTVPVHMATAVDVPPGYIVNGADGFIEDATARRKGGNMSAAGFEDWFLATTDHTLLGMYATDSGLTGVAADSGQKSAAITALRRNGAILFDVEVQLNYDHDVTTSSVVVATSTLPLPRLQLSQTSGLSLWAAELAVGAALNASSSRESSVDPPPPFFLYGAMSAAAGNASLLLEARVNASGVIRASTSSSSAGGKGIPPPPPPVTPSQWQRLLSHPLCVPSAAAATTTTSGGNGGDMHPGTAGLVGTLVNVSLTALAGGGGDPAASIIEGLRVRVSVVDIDEDDRGFPVTIRAVSNSALASSGFLASLGARVPFDVADGSTSSSSFAPRSALLSSTTSEVAPKATSALLPCIDASSSSGSAALASSEMACGITRGDISDSSAFSALWRQSYNRLSSGEGELWRVEALAHAARATVMPSSLTHQSWKSLFQKAQGDAADNSWIADLPSSSRRIVSTNGSLSSSDVIEPNPSSVLTSSTQLPLRQPYGASHMRSATTNSSPLSFWDTAAAAELVASEKFFPFCVFRPFYLVARGTTTLSSSSSLLNLRWTTWSGQASSVNISLASTVSQLDTLQTALQQYASAFARAAGGTATLGQPTLTTQPSIETSAALAADAFTYQSRSDLGVVAAFRQLGLLNSRCQGGAPISVVFFGIGGMFLLFLVHVLVRTCYRGAACCHSRFRKPLAIRGSQQEQLELLERRRLRPRLRRLVASQSLQAVDLTPPMTTSAAGAAAVASANGVMAALAVGMAKTVAMAEGVAATEGKRELVGAVSKAAASGMDTMAVAAASGMERAMALADGLSAATVVKANSGSRWVLVPGATRGVGTFRGLLSMHVHLSGFFVTRCHFECGPLHALMLWSHVASLCAISALLLDYMSDVVAFPWKSRIMACGALSAISSTLLTQPLSEYLYRRIRVIDLRHHYTPLPILGDRLQRLAALEAAAIPAAYPVLATEGRHDDVSVLRDGMLVRTLVRGSRFQQDLCDSGVRPVERVGVSRHSEAALKGIDDHIDIRQWPAYDLIAADAHRTAQRLRGSRAAAGNDVNDDEQAAAAGKAGGNGGVAPVLSNTSFPAASPAALAGHRSVAYGVEPRTTVLIDADHNMRLWGHVFNVAVIVLATCSTQLSIAGWCFGPWSRGIVPSSGSSASYGAALFSVAGDASWTIYRLDAFAATVGAALALDFVFIQAIYLFLVWLYRTVYRHEDEVDAIEQSMGAGRATQEKMVDAAAGAYHDFHPYSMEAIDEGIKQS